MASSANEFKNAIDKAYTTQPNVKLNQDTMGDAIKYKQGFTEEVDEDGNEYETFLSKRIKKNKKEAKEATGSGSVGAYSAPVFGGNDEFWEKSKSETPKLEESNTEKVEAKEATGSGSVGAYSTPAMWAKSTSKKDWGPSRKTQYPGGGFVKIKKKCTKFPYCNQGDINNLKITKNESVKEAIETVANKLGISKQVIMNILEHEYEKINKTNK
jgi:hypothetical protein